MEYPTVNGVGVNPFELRLPESHLNLERAGNFNNHHNAWEARKFGGSAILTTFRNLERHQFLMPVDQHNTLHQIYSPPKLPKLEQAMRVVIEAYDSSERLRIGSAHNPTFSYLDEVIPIVVREYNEQAVRSVL